MARKKTKIDREAKFIDKVSKETGLSGALLYYAAHFGIIGVFTKKSKQ